MPLPSAGTSRRNVLLLTLSVFLGAPACGQAEEEPDAGQLEPFLRSYVDALNRKDSAGLARLLGNHDQEQIATRLARFGGQELRDVRISHQRESPKLYVVFLSARSGSAGQRFEAREIAAWEKRRWTLTPWPRQLRQPQRPPT